MLERLLAQSQRARGESHPEATTYIDNSEFTLLS